MPEPPLSGAAVRHRHGPLVEQCRRKILDFCGARFTELVENADKALLEFAQRAESDAVQSRFFEAMGQISHQRVDIERIFRAELSQGFERLAGKGTAAPDQATQAAPQGIELALVEPEEMEESVAAENLILRANADCFPQLFALSLRLGAIARRQRLKDTEIPGGPSHLVHSYKQALKELDIEVRVKVVLYALFDKFVLKPIKPTYDAYNALLADAGVLPNLKPVHVKTSPSQSGARASTAAKDAREAPLTEAAGSAAAPSGAPAETRGAPGEPQSLGGELFDAILELMANRRPGQERAMGARRSGPSPTPEESALQSRQLLSAISSVQSQRTPQAVSTAVAEALRFPSVEVDTAFLQRVKDALGQEREQILSAIDQNKMSTMDADLIDLIGMLFEYMLNDPVLPNVAKALLSHLHTPYLKVALIDRRLLVDSRHPARRLLDQMVEAGSLWVEEGNPTRGMFPVMQQVVDRVLREFTDNVGLFEELLAHFEEKMREQQRRSDTTEQRTQEAALGREKLTLAKQRAAREIQTAMDRHPLPQPVRAFLSETWLDHLTFILLRDPEQDQGRDWRRAGAVMEQLVALFDPQANAQARHARLATLPKLRDDVAITAQRLGRFSSTNVSALLALLDSPEGWKVEPRVSPETAHRESPGPASGTPVPQITRAVTLDDDLTEPERHMVERLRRMRFGTWFEFRGAPGMPPRRIKLSWMSPLTSTCMFVDRAGMQAEIKSLRDLAQDILAGRARVIPKPKHPFIDRALVSIRRMLQGGDKPGAPDSNPI